jgi:hypothetical protein
LVFDPGAAPTAKHRLGLLRFVYTPVWPFGSFKSRVARLAWASHNVGETKTISHHAPVVHSGLPDGGTTLDATVDSTPLLFSIPSPA